MKVVIDTNIYLSGLIFPDSKPALVLYLAQEGKFSLFCSDFILSEIRRNLTIKFDLKNTACEKIIENILTFTKVIIPEKHHEIIKAKKDDNFILDCAVAAKADFLVTGDKKHILPLKKIGKTKIVSTTEFIEMMSQK